MVEGLCQEGQGLHQPDFPPLPNALEKYLSAQLHISNILIKVNDTVEGNKVVLTYSTTVPPLRSVR